MEVNVLKNCYQVSYSKLQGMFMLVNMETRHIVKVCDMFWGISDTIKILRKKADIEIIFSDSAIDELQLRGFRRDEIPSLKEGY